MRARKRLATEERVRIAHLAAPTVVVVDDDGLSLDGRSASGRSRQNVAAGDGGGDDGGLRPEGRHGVRVGYRRLVVFRRLAQALVGDAAENEAGSRTNG